MSTGYNEAMSIPPIIVFLGGADLDEPDPRTRRSLETLGSKPIVIAADSGFERARLADVEVDHLVGDLDSIDPGLLDRIEQVRIHAHPADKDATDAELALHLARRIARDQPTDLLVVGGTGGRLDHLLADIALLASELTEPFRLIAHLDRAIIRIVRPGPATVFDGVDGEIVSLLPQAGPVDGVDTAGLRWPLVDATLHAGTTRGVSNELAGGRATVSIRSGVLAVIQPGVAAARIEDRSGTYDPSPT